MTQRKNYLKISDPKINKIFWWVSAAIIVTAAMIFAFAIAALISNNTAQEGLDLFSLYPELLPFIKLLVAFVIILFIIFMTIMLYVYFTNKENDHLAKQQTEAASPLQGVAKEQQEKIIELLKSVAMPAPNKQTINHARTAKFIHALTALELIDINRDSKHLMAWIEYATGYLAGETRVFNQALKAVKINDREVLKYREQIAQIIAQ